MRGNHPGGLSGAVGLGAWKLDLYADAELKRSLLGNTPLSRSPYRSLDLLYSPRLGVPMPAAPPIPLSPPGEALLCELVGHWKAEAFVVDPSNFCCAWHKYHQAEKETPLKRPFPRTQVWQPGTHASLATRVGAQPEALSDDNSGFQVAPPWECSGTAA